MRNTKVLQSSIISLIGACTVVLGFAASASASTINVASDSTKAGYESAVLKTADHLATLLNTDGGLDWIITGETSGGNSTTYNTQGVTAQMFLDAYNFSHEQKYLTDAESVGGAILTMATSSNDITTARQNAYNIVFLQNLATASGNTAYSDEANAMLSQIFSNSNYWTTNGSCDPTGCTPTTLLASDESYRSAPQTSADGSVAWDLNAYVQALKNSGDTTNASALEQLIVSYVTDANYTTSTPDYALGLASALNAAVTVSDSTGESSVESLLQSAQGGDGSFGQTSEGQIQVTAYAIMALSAAGDSAHSASAAQFLTSSINSSGDGWTETGGSDEYSEDDSEAAHSLSLLLGTGTFYNLQDAIDAASSGDTINVASGSYDAFKIDGKTNLTVAGAGAGSTTIAPTALIDTGVADKYDVDMHSSVFVNNSTGIMIEGMTIESTGDTPVRSGAAGTGVNNAMIFWNSSSGTIKDSEIKGTYSINGVQTGQGIAVDASSGTNSLTVDNVNISGFQKNGIQAIDGNGATSGATDTITLTVSSSTITGAGATSAIAQNGVLAWNRGGGSVTATIDHSTISGFDYSPATNSGDFAAAVLAYGGGAVTSVHNTTFSSDPQFTISTTAGSGNIDATNNYWGSVTGPATTTLDSDTGTISYSPWWTDAGMTTLGYTTTPGTGGNPTVTTTSDTTLTGTSTQSGSVDVTVTIPSGTTITGPSNWDGTIEAPTATTTSLSIANETTNVTSAVVIGSSGFDLTFDHAVRLFFPGQAGKSAGYYDASGNFHDIFNLCTSDDQVSVDAAPVNDCRIDSGSDLVVWTKHFSTFLTYTVTSTSNSPVTSGGGGGGGGNGPVSTGSGSASVTTSSGSTASTGSVSSGGQVGGGQVLGAAAYNFQNNLTVGSSGNDVTELQKVLIAEGDLTIAAPTGYFGALTKAAVVKYQTAHGISPASGFVGPLTRAELNKGSTPTMSDEQKSLLIQSLQAQLQTLLAQIAALTASSTASTTVSH